jgi:hypothetical protein
MFRGRDIAAIAEAPVALATGAVPKTRELPGRKPWKAGLHNSWRNRWAGDSPCHVEPGKDTAGFKNTRFPSGARRSATCGTAAYRPDGTQCHRGAVRAHRGGGREDAGSIAGAYSVHLPITFSDSAAEATPIKNGRAERPRSSFFMRHSLSYLSPQFPLSAGFSVSTRLGRSER